MKKYIIMQFVLLVFWAVTISCVAEETKCTLVFNGVQLGSTIEEANDVWDFPFYAPGDEYHYYRVAYFTDKRNYPWDERENTEPGLSEVFLYSDLNIPDVAGYAPSLSTAFFVRPVKNGALVTKDAEAVLYGGYYDFWHVHDIPAMVSDLAKKLTSIYGEPISTNKRVEMNGIQTMWIVDTNAAITLNSYLVNNNVRLSYILLGADDLIDASIATLGQSNESKDVSNNTNGL